METFDPATPSCTSAASPPCGARMGDALEVLRHLLRPLDGDEDHDAVAARLDALEHAHRTMADLRRDWMDSFARWLLDRGDLVVGPIRWYCGVERTWKCRDPGATLVRLLWATEGDVQGLAAFLSADAMKAGACRAALSPSDFAQLFDRVERSKAQQGKPRPVREDTRFRR